jgi:hypothetical protein
MATSVLQDPSWEVSPAKRSCFCEGCGRTYASVIYFNKHLKSSCYCAEIHTGQLAAPQDQQDAPDGQGARQMRDAERCAKGLDLCTHLRIKKLIPGTHVQFMKDELRTSVFPMMQRHLQADLTPKWNGTADELTQILERNLNLFGGIESAAREHSRLLNRPGFVRAI